MATPFDRTLRALAHDHAGGAWRWWLGALVAAAAWGTWFIAAPVTVYEVAPHARIESAHAPQPVVTTVAGKVERSYMRLGMAVQAGTVLVELDAAEQRLQRAAAIAELDAIAPQLEATEHEIEAAGAALDDGLRAAGSATDATRARLTEARANAAFKQEQRARFERLQAEHRVPEIEVLRVRAEAEQAMAAVEALVRGGQRDRAEASSAAQSRRADIEALHRRHAELRGAAEAARAGIARLDAEIERRRIRAPLAGTLGDVAPREVGAYAESGAVLGQVVPAGDLIIVAEFAPVQVFGRIAAGQSASMRLDGFPWAQYGAVNARVLRVASEVRDGRVRVELEPLTDARTAPLLRHGLPGTVEVAVDHTRPALLALRAAGQRLARPAAGHS